MREPWGQGVPEWFLGRCWAHDPVAIRRDGRFRLPRTL